MKPSFRCLLSVFTALFFIPFFASADPTDTMTAEEIMSKHSLKNTLDSEVEFVTIVTEDSEGNTERHAILFCTQKNKEGFHDYLIRVVSPAKFDGVGLLARQQKEGEVERYFYLPALGKVKRVTGGGSGGSQNFLGSNFTYEDLMKESPDQYKYKRMPNSTLDGASCYVIRAENSDKGGDKASTYAYREIHISKSDFNLLKIDFVPPDTDKPAKTLRAYDYNSTKVDGPTMRPLRAEMRDHVANSVSWLTVIRSRFNEKMDPILFTPEGLAAWNKEQKETLLASLNNPKSAKK